MNGLTYLFVVAMSILVGIAAVLAVSGLVMVQVRWIVRLSRQISDPDARLRAPWRFSDCGRPPGWLP